MKIVFLDSKTVGDLPNLKDLKGLGDVTFYETTSPAETKGRIVDAEVVITNKVVLDRELITGAKELNLICIAATGMNNVDLEAAEEAGIPVKNVSGYAAASVAQTTFAMLLKLMQNIPYYDRYVKSGDYSRSKIFTHLGEPFHELNGKRFGIVGLGTIGSATAKVAEAFGAEVVYYSTSGKNSDQPYKQLSLDELLESSDVISIHAPLNENTAGLIGEPELKRMKTSAILINTGRGGIVDEAALAHAIDDGEIAGAALDVFETEPLPADNPLLKVKKKERLILVPHIAWSSIEARTELMEGVIRNIREFSDGNRKS
ncbi:MAG: D-2-hydroxyacid dehydrogenase [Balneolaceae bacterium]|nr:D-2-hydroxyacid dehydrogenase [Balneolaceae bacterium]MCH8548273.1 D-2-hydroxyacid dehydrogenase [Balneolaceae bacterium]